MLSLLLLSREWLLLWKGGRKLKSLMGHEVHLLQACSSTTSYSCHPSFQERTNISHGRIPGIPFSYCFYSILETESLTVWLALIQRTELLQDLFKPLDFVEEQWDFIHSFHSTERINFSFVVITFINSLKHSLELPTSIFLFL
jgi:hypothetical protein